jgi:hypothetical protein
MVITDSVADFKIGRVVSRTFSVFVRNLATFLLVAAVIMVPVIAINFYNGSPSFVLGGAAKGVWFGVLAFLLQIVCTYLLQAALVEGTITDLNGERPDMGGALSTGFALAVPVFVITILSLLGMALGFVLLIVPGVIFAIGWSVAVPVRVVERTDIRGAFKRSWELTKGYRWKIFWLILMYAIVAYLAAFLTALVAGVSFLAATTALNNTPYIVLEWLLRVVLAVITSIGITAIYYELRTVKEGMAPEELAAAFD